MKKLGFVTLTVLLSNLQAGDSLFSTFTNYFPSSHFQKRALPESIEQEIKKFADPNHRTDVRSSAEQIMSKFESLENPTEEDAAQVGKDLAFLFAWEHETAKNLSLNKGKRDLSPNIPEITKPVKERFSSKSGYYPIPSEVLNSQFKEIDTELKNMHDNGYYLCRQTPETCNRHTFLEGEKTALLNFVSLDYYSSDKAKKEREWFQSWGEQAQEVLEKQKQEKNQQKKEKKERAKLLEAEIAAIEEQEKALIKLELFKQKPKYFGQIAIVNNPTSPFALDKVQEPLIHPGPGGFKEVIPDLNRID